MLIPLAHGVFGVWDELIPILLVGGFILILVGAGVMARREDAKLAKLEQQSSAEQPTQQNPQQPRSSEADTTTPAEQVTQIEQIEQTTTAADHYRLD